MEYCSRVLLTSLSGIAYLIIQKYCNRWSLSYWECPRGHSLKRRIRFNACSQGVPRHANFEDDPACKGAKSWTRGCENYSKNLGGNRNSLARRRTNTSNKSMENPYEAFSFDKWFFSLRFSLPFYARILLLFRFFFSKNRLFSRQLRYLLYYRDDYSTNSNEQSHSLETEGKTAKNTLDICDNVTYTISMIVRIVQDIDTQLTSN